MANKQFVLAWLPPNTFNRFCSSSYYKGKKEQGMPLFWTEYGGVTYYWPRPDLKGRMIKDGARRVFELEE